MWTILSLSEETDFVHWKKTLSFVKERNGTVNTMKKKEVLPGIESRKPSEFMTGVCGAGVNTVVRWRTGNICFVDSI